LSGTQAVEVMIFGTGGFVGSLMFTVQSITVGRDPAAMVRLDDPSVSLKHALLVLEAGSLRVKDLGSRTGAERAAQGYGRDRGRDVPPSFHDPQGLGRCVRAHA